MLHHKRLEFSRNTTSAEEGISRTRAYVRREVRANTRTIGIGSVLGSEESQDLQMNRDGLIIGCSTTRV